MVDRLCVSLSLTLCVRVDRGLASSLSPFSFPRLLLSILPSLSSPFVVFFSPSFIFAYFTFLFSLSLLFHNPPPLPSLPSLCSLCIHTLSNLFHNPLCSGYPYLYLFYLHLPLSNLATLFFIANLLLHALPFFPLTPSLLIPTQG